MWLRSAHAVSNVCGFAEPMPCAMCASLLVGFSYFFSLSHEEVNVGSVEAGGAELRTKPAPKIVRKIYEPMRLCKMF